MDSQDKLKFWTFLAGLMLMVAVAVMLVDISIKAAILEESNALKRTIERQRDGQGKAETNPVGTGDNGHSPGAVLDIHATGMEAGNVRDGGKAAAKNRRTRGNQEPEDRTDN